MDLQLIGIIVAVGCLAAISCWGGLYCAIRWVNRVRDDQRELVLLDQHVCEAAALPVLWAIAWPFIVRLAAVMRWLRPKMQQSIRPLQLDRAGMPKGISSVHLACARVVASVVCVLAAWLAMVLLSPDRCASGTTCMLLVVLAGMLGSLWPVLWLRQRAKTRVRLIERELPFFLDLLALCVQGGLSIQGALGETVRHGPTGVMRDEIARVLSELRAGQTRTAAFEALGQRSASRALRTSVGAILQAEALGISLGTQLKALAHAQNIARFERAERQALKAPVKLLLPLMVFIFPCTFIVIGFPIAMSIQASFS